MDNGIVIYSAIKRLLFKYNIVLRTEKEYENFINDLAMILKI